MSIELAAENAALVLALMTVLWMVSVRLHDVSIVDPWWSIAFLLITVHTAFRTGLSSAKVALLLAVGSWALRLWLHLLLRSRGKPEDPRYAAFRRRFGPQRYWWFSFFQVFLLQGALAWLISSPLQLAASAPPRSIGLIELIGLAIFAVGFVFEAIADAQLQAFRRDPQNRGQVMDRGLWRWSRHPNYFGESMLWWGFGVLALGQPFGWATLLAPALMTFLLLKVSGVTMLDAHLGRSKPRYADYMRETSAFVPWPRSSRTSR